MAAVTRLFNGSTFTFDSSPVAKLIGISFKIGGEWIDVTEPADANKLFEVSPQQELEVSLKFKGACALAYGDKGTAAIVWKDGSTSTCPGTWQVGPQNVNGDWNAPITGDCVLRPTVPDSV